MTAQVFLLPVVALILWSFVIWGWMYATRLPAMSKLRIAPQEAQNPRGEWRGKMPEQAGWVADNYNHLHEQPTVFYALMVVMFLMEQATGATLVLAWAYVALRVGHSLAQIIGNRVVLRFGLFLLSTLVLIALAGVALCGVVFA